jgi:hypothetical protein
MFTIQCVLFDINKYIKLLHCDIPLPIYPFGKVAIIELALL